MGIVFLFLIASHYLGLVRAVETGIRKITIPILREMHGFSIKIGENYQFFRNRSEFFKAYEECSLSSNNMSVIESQMKTLSEENLELKKQLNYVQKNKIQSVLAKVIGREILTSSQTIIIDRGEAEGIKLDQPVIVGDGILIGKITKVEKDFAMVRLVNDNQSRIGSVILNKEKSQGVVEGGFGISLRMNLIPRDEDVIVGDQVVTSGLEKAIPRGLLLGSVAVIENEPYKPFQQAILTPGTNLSKLTSVSILLTK